MWTFVCGDVGSLSPRWPTLCFLTAGLPQVTESQDSEQFFRKVLGVSEVSTLEGMKPILEGSKGEVNRTALPQRPLLSGELLLLQDDATVACYLLSQCVGHDVMY